MLAIFAFAFSALCEAGQAIDFSHIQAQLTYEAEMIDLRQIFTEIMSGEFSIEPGQVMDKVTGAVYGRVGSVSKFLTKAAFFMLMTAFFKRLTPEGKNAKGAHLAIHLIVALSMYKEISVFFALAKEAIERIASLIDALTPIFVSVIALTGDAHTSAFITPLGAFVAGALSTYFQKGAFRILEALACLCLAGAVSDLPLGKLTDTVRSMFKWLIGVIVSVFLFFMSTGGAIAGAYDGAFLKGLKFAADSLIPIVGSDIAGKMESITGSAQLVKSAAGVTGVIALVSACLMPAIDVFLAMWGLRALSAIVQCVSDKETTNLADSFSGVFSLMFSLILASLCMAVMYAGVFVGIGRRALF
ncbi:MAG: hypothetical protein IKJ65_01400 [Clostridia bacterium]|nr:hypothetical protein [Clostridia bacterium]